MDLRKRLDDLWKIEEKDREKGIKLLTKIYTNVINNPSDPKFRDLNFSKIRQKFALCKPCFYLLFTAGFTQSVDGSRLQFQPNKVSNAMLMAANKALNDKINGIEMALDENEKIIRPSEAPAKKTTKEKKKIMEKIKEAKDMQKKQQEMQQMVQNNNNNKDENNNDNNHDNNNDDDKNKMDLDENDKNDNNKNDEENNNNNDQNDQNEKDMDGDTNMTENNEISKAETQEINEALNDVGLSEEELQLIKQIREAKGTTVHLNMKELHGLSKNEKIKLVKDKQRQYRAEKAQAEVRAKLAKERKRRENIKAQQEQQRKREEYQRKMAAQRKAREKALDRERKKRIREKIAADKERKKKERERLAAKKKAAAEADENQSK